MTNPTAAPLSTAAARGALAMAMVGSSVAVSTSLTTGPLLAAQGLRYAAAAVILVLVARVAGVRLHRPVGVEWLWLAGVAGTGLVAFNVAVVRGVAHAEPAVVATAVACAPVLIGLVGPLLERRAPEGRVALAATVVTAGSVLVAGTGRTDGVGVLYAVLALVCEACFTLLAVPVLGRHGPWGVAVHSVWMAAAGLLVLGAVTEGPTAATHLTGPQLLALLHLAVVVTAAAFVLWYGAVARLGSARAALLCGVAPISAALLGIVVTGRVPAVPVWAGIGVVTAGLALGLVGRRTGPVVVTAT